MTRPKRSCQQKRPKTLSSKKNWNWTWENYIVNGKPWIKKETTVGSSGLPTLRETERRRGVETSPNKTRHQKNDLTKDEGSMDKGADREGGGTKRGEGKELVTKSHYCLTTPWMTTVSSGKGIMG
eukprot:GHVN01083041.1.p1 GENE.GHVN01083041.1~~GHVN01083041.1.p1  ORF type:complete len:125 (+),score=17.42 GHVN01083041.1:351-725(+)